MAEESWNILFASSLSFLVIIILVAASVFSKYYIPNTIIAHEQRMGDCQLKGIEDTENVLITTFLAVVTIFVISLSSSK